MKYIGSSIGVNDQVLLNDINYFSISGPSFTPGIGGTYKQPAPPSLNNSDIELPDDDNQSVGCKLARSAGWGTPSWCSEKTKTCDLERPLEPQRHIEPGRLDYLMCAIKEREAKEARGPSENFVNLVWVVAIFAAMYFLFKPRK